MKRLVSLVRGIVGDCLYLLLPTAWHIVNCSGAIAGTVTWCPPDGQKTTAGERGTRNGHIPGTAIAGTAIAWQRNR